METLRKKAEIAFLWSFIDSVGVQTVRFGIGVILARLLLPREFGLIGMLTIFIGIANSFVVSGFGSALIQKKELSIEDTSSVFYFNLVAGVVLAGLLWITSHWIASFYQQPILSSLTRGMSLVIVAGAFGVVQTALLTRKMDFKTQTKIGLISVSCSGFVGVGMAYHGFGVWSLVVQQLVAAVLRSMLLWMLNTWRPALVFKLGALRGLFSFGSKLLLAGLLNQIFQEK